MNKEYQLLVKTNCYTGNFEREMCAFMTGQVGECGVGDEYTSDDISEMYEDVIAQKPDDHGCYRPVEIDGENSNNFIIYLHRKLTEDEIEHMKDRAKIWEEIRPYEYLDKEFKFLGVEQFEVKIERKKV